MKKKLEPLGIIKNTEKLKQLIAEYPDYPIVVIAGEEANTGDYNSVYCSKVSFNIEEILDCELPYNDEYICCDRIEFEENLADWLAIQNKEMTDSELEELLKQTLAEYEPYWVKVIEIYASN